MMVDPWKLLREIRNHLQAADSMDSVITRAGQDRLLRKLAEILDQE